jgi:hypothetical protein
MLKTKQFQRDESIPRTVPTSDIYFAAYASSRGIPPQLKKIHNKILFIFPLTDEFNDVSREYHVNPTL